jgi:hypothetical protein
MSAGAHNRNGVATRCRASLDWTGECARPYMDLRGRRIPLRSK